MELKIAEEVARQAVEEIRKLRGIIADLTAENDRLRAELCEKAK
jgi:hypothetical protein